MLINKKQGVCIVLERNRGSATLEATLVLPLFIFFVLCLYHMTQCRLADNCIYEAATETAEYMAEYAYLDGNNILLPDYVFNSYIDDSEIIEKYVKDGLSGICFIGTVPLDEEGYVSLVVQYETRILVPFMPVLTQEHRFVIRQKAYVGAGYGCDEMDEQEDECYVYVTDNRDVYHSTRSCTYLCLSIQMCQIKQAVEEGYTACEICGQGEAESVYVTDHGTRFHADRGCSGLKRTVYRIRMSETGGIGGCSRCVTPDY